MIDVRSDLEPLNDTGRSLLFTDARTANSFADVPVSDEELRGIWDLAKWSPSGGNGQPLRALFIRTSEGRERLAPHMLDSNRDKVLASPAVAVLAYDSRFHDHFSTTFPDRAEMLAERFGSMPDEIVESMAEYNAALQSGVFLLAVRAHGLAAGPMGGFDRAGVDAEFFAGTTWKSHLVVNIGHPGENPWFDRLPRVPAETAVAWA
ncbi:malonic semialdehyde reductase [Gordonia hankookensis]|uniref:Malonic semialdehyde reductase n=1 Tax=Gordonia hankookensis TaxID=589403 RepID=A0ABR7WC44_9ACTN|nr:malonic semialdehyde reductase [Gordonia hankookensis]MBD1319918.1 malonic semialdehyde reductase [Gordonia hankookensis]